MNRSEYLLTKVAEECSEIAQRVSKALCFGLLEVQQHPGANPGGLNNAERIIGEYIDLIAVMEMCAADGLVQFVDPMFNDSIRRRINEKKAKVRKYMTYSETVGALDEKHPKLEKS